MRSRIIRATIIVGVLFLTEACASREDWNVWLSHTTHFASGDHGFFSLRNIKDLSASGDRYKGGTILDPADGKIYKAEVWVEDGKLKVRGYLGVFYKTQTWVKGS